MDKRVSLVLFLLALFCYSYFVQPAGWNENSRMALIMSVVYHHQLNIDPYEELTEDKALYNGHYYSDKAIGTAMLGVPVYAVVSEVRGSEDYADLFGNTYAVTVMVVALPSATLTVLLYQLMRLLGGSRTWALLLTLFYSFGTLAFPFSTMLFGHQVAAAFAFAAFFVLVIARLRSSSVWLLFIAGVLASLAVLMEYTVVLIAAFLLLYAATFVRPKRRLVLYILGGVPAAALLLAYNWYTLDNPLSFAYGYHATFPEMATGLFSITQPRWSSFITITLGPRGLLTRSIFLWLLPFGVWQMSRIVQWRRECGLCILVGLAFVTWNSGLGDPDQFGGSSPGARYLVPSLPFLIVPLVFLTRLPRPYALLAKSLLLLAGVWSIGLCFLMCVTGPKVPDWIVNPISEYWLARFAREDLVPNMGMLVFGLGGIESLAPLAMVFVMALSAFVYLSRSVSVRPVQ